MGAGIADGEARYWISLTDGVWRAARVGNSLMTFTADSGPQLRGMIYDDYQSWVRQTTKNPGCSI